MKRMWAIMVFVAALAAAYSAWMVSLAIRAHGWEAACYWGLTVYGTWNVYRPIRSAVEASRGVRRIRAETERLRQEWRDRMTGRRAGSPGDRGR